MQTAKGGALPTAQNRQGKSTDGKEEENTSAGGEGDFLRSDYKLADGSLMDEEFPDHGDDDNYLRGWGVFGLSS